MNTRWKEKDYSKKTKHNHAGQQITFFNVERISSKHIVTKETYCQTNFINSVVFF